MGYLDKYTTRLTENGNASLADAVRVTASKISSEYISKFSYKEHVVSLLAGEVQSGKTSQMFGLMCAAADEGFKLFLLLTTDITLLQQQTLFRVRQDLPEFCICGESNEYDFRMNNMKRPVIIVLKKNGNILKRWKNNLTSSHFCEGNPLFIVDDEADAASLNTLINSQENKKSTVNRRLEEIKQTASSSIYLQVTGTPQAILLQAHESGWHPYFTHYFRPGRGYIGGNSLFNSELVPQVILTDNEEASDLLQDDEFAENGLKDALFYHLVTSADIFLNGGVVSNFMIHPSMDTAQHAKFSEKIGEYLNEIAASLNEPNVNDKFREVYGNLKSTKPSIKPFDNILSFIKETIENDKVSVLTINSNSNYVENTNYHTGVNIIVGGNSLGRGITFPKLQTSYYCRVAKNPQADTMWQHARMFGYDREWGLLRVFIPPVLYKLFVELNATNNSIIAQIEKANPADVNIRYPNNIRPTRKNVLDKEVVKMVSGGVNTFPFFPENKSIETLDAILSRFTDEAPYSVNLRVVVDILDQIISNPNDWNTDDFKGFVQAIIAENPGAQGKLIVRRERDITSGTGTLLSQNDRELGEKIKDEVVLTVYKVTGAKGWNNRKIWIPNIKLPGNSIYYCI